jgi:hypothetical protein
MQNLNKEYIKLKLASCFRKILKQKKNISRKNKLRNIQDLRLVDSLRQLEADSGLSYTLIQTAYTAKRDIQFSSLIILIESLEISFTDFAKIYDKLSDEQIEIEKMEIEKKKRR